MFPEPTYPDFYVAVLTIVPLVLVGQFVVLRQFQGSSLGLLRRFFVVIGHAVTGILALASIIVALAVIGGFLGDEADTRLVLLGMTMAQVFLGIYGSLMEALSK